MRATEIIQFLTTAVDHHGDFSVDINNLNGIYQSIKDIKMRHWDDNDGNHHLVAEIIPVEKYDPKESIK